MRKVVDGRIRCSFGHHMVAVEEFKRHTRGHLMPWCCSCKRDYDSAIKAIKRVGGKNEIIGNARSAEIEAKAG